jgi:hypothetical protein
MQGAVKDAEAKKRIAPDLPDAGFHRSGIQRVHDDRLDANVPQRRRRIERSRQREYIMLVGSGATNQRLADRTGRSCDQNSHHSSFLARLAATAL